MAESIRRKSYIRSRSGIIVFGFAFGMLLSVLVLTQAAQAQDPAEPASGAPAVNALPRPAGKLDRASIDENFLRAIIEEQVACGTRDTFSSWTDPKRGVGCGRDKAPSHPHRFRVSGCQRIREPLVIEIAALRPVCVRINELRRT